MNRAWITATALNTPLGDRVDGVLDAMLAGRSGLGPWRSFEPPPAAPTTGGDLGSYDIRAKLDSLNLPKEAHRRLDRMLRRVPWSTKLSLLITAELANAAGLWTRPPDPEETAVFVAGHNLSPRYALDTWRTFQREPDYIDALFAVHMLDTNHAACASELLGTRGAIATLGASCASGNLGLRAALDELREGAQAVIVLSPLYEYAPTTFQSLGMMRATTEAVGPGASRPFDAARSGFAPAHGLAAVLVEREDSARARGAEPLAELLGAEAGSDACHRPPRPDPEAQAALIRGLLERCGVTPAEVDLISAHAASTPAGDLAEARAIALAFGEASPHINAPKSMLGHTGWSASLVQAVLAIAQLRRGEVHGSVPLDNPDPALPITPGPAGPRLARVALNNAFGFGGLNCVSLLRSPPCA